MWSWGMDAGHEDRRQQGTSNISFKISYFLGYPVNKRGIPQMSVEILASIDPTSPSLPAQQP